MEGFLAAAFWAFIIGMIIVNSSAWPVIVGIFQFLLWAGPIFGCVYFVYRKREAIARWYYFTFYRHPAESAVRTAIDHGQPLDGKALSAVLADLPSDNSILWGVRIEQGERLVAEMRKVTEAEIKRDRAHAREDYERAAFIGAQEALAHAAVALERARAAQQASKSV